MPVLEAGRSNQVGSKTLTLPLVYSIAARGINAVD
jgi:hypothetical protein